MTYKRPPDAASPHQGHVKTACCFPPQRAYRVGAPVEQSARCVPGQYPLCLPIWAPSVRRSGRGRGQLAVRVRASPRCHSNGERCAGGAPASAMPTTWPRRVSLALMPFCAPGSGRSGMLRFGPYGADSRAFRGHNFGAVAAKSSIKIILNYNLSRNARYIVRSRSRKL